MRSSPNEEASFVAIDELLSEEVERAQERENAVFDELRQLSRGKIVLFGAGRLGRKVALALRQNGIAPLAFADNSSKFHSAEIDGVPVVSLTTAADRWKEEALFVVTTFRPDGGGIRARLQEIKRLGCHKTTSFLPFGWKCEGILPHFGSDRPSRLLQNARELASCAGLWCDEPSRETFRQALAWRLRAMTGDSQAPSPDQYFPREILRPNPEESFIDCGAFDGDTLRAAPWPFARVMAIEPDPMNAQKLRTSEKMPTQIHEVLLGHIAGSARFNGTGSMESSRSESGVLNIAVERLDELAKFEHPTFIKLDVEGDELMALQGGRNTLARCQPVVAVCVYHRPEDLWTIPLFLSEVMPSHRMYLRAHAWDGFELVAYAVPRERCLSP